MDKTRILIVDDEPSIIYTLKNILNPHEIFDFSTGLSVLESLKKGDKYDVLIVDYRLQSISGIDILIEAKQALKNYRAILLTAYSNKEILEQAINDKLIYKVVNKPIYPDIFKEVVDNAIISLREELLGVDRIERTQRLLDNLVAQPAKGNRLIHISSEMKNVLEGASKYALSNANIIITGENGVGKEVIANIVHEKSGRSEKPFVKVNCSAIPESLFESEMFGHEKGAFTGAVSDKLGKFAIANEGTIFLDEIGELPLKNQSKLLRAVENKEISPIGSLKTVKINVRIIAATNKNLKEMVEKGAFREDLYFRLNVINIHVPPLRERKEDIPILSIYFANTIAVDEGGVLKNIDAEALDILKNYNFKGNVRELKNLIYRAYLSCENSIITKKDFEFLFGNEVKKTENIFENTMFFNSFKEIVERKYLETQLEKHKYSLKNTAQSLGLQVSNLSTKLKEIGISLKK